MKKRSKDREPELIQYKLEYSLNDGFPAERFFMALSPKEALEQLLLTCIKSSPFDNFNEQEKEILAEAFSSGSTDLLKKPDLLVIPEALPDKDFPEPESLPPPAPIQPRQQGEHCRRPTLLLLVCAHTLWETPWARAATVSMPCRFAVRGQAGG